MGGYILGIGHRSFAGKFLMNYNLAANSNTLSHALNNLNRALMLDLQAHFADPLNKPAPSKENLSKRSLVCLRQWQS